MHERAHLVGVLDPQRRLHAARDIYAVGLVGAHDLAHVTRFETACDEHLPVLQQLASQVPVPRAAGPATLVGGPGIEHDRVEPSGCVRDHVVADLQHFHDRPARVEARSFGAMELQQVEADEVRDLAHLRRVLVDEDADDRRSHRQAADARLGLLGCDAPVGRAEMEPKQVGARFNSRVGALGFADAANLDLDHQREANSRRLADGSGALSSTAATRIASAPASRIRRASSTLWMPLSETSTTSLGTSLRRRSVRPRSISKVRRSRWLTPTTCAPASMASETSFSSCTSTSADRPRLRTTASSLRSPAGSPAATMRSTASAPAARASSTS